MLPKLSAVSNQQTGGKKGKRGNGETESNMRNLYLPFRLFPSSPFRLSHSPLITSLQESPHQSAIDLNADAVHVARGFRGKEDDHVRHLLGIADTPEGNISRTLLQCLIKRLVRSLRARGDAALQSIGKDTARQHGVDGNVVFAHFP